MKKFYLGPIKQTTRLFINKWIFIDALNKNCLMNIYQMERYYAITPSGNYITDKKEFDELLAIIHNDLSYIGYEILPNNYKLLI